MLDDALFYARKGIQVLPLWPGEKNPMTSHGKDDASSDESVIRMWWHRNPNANIGIRPPQGVVILDVDPRNGGDIDALGLLPPTLAARTGSGGWHLWFGFDGQALGQLAGFDGVDLKTNKGYIVAPPSIHPCGGRYEWYDKSPVAPLPKHLRLAVTRQPRTPLIFTEVPTNELVKRVLESQEGERNHTFFKAILQAQRQGADTSELESAALAIGLTDREVESTVRSAQRYVSEEWF